LNYHVEEISDFDAFVSLEKEWNPLLAAAPVNAPFLRHEWFRIWWKAFGVGKRLAILAVRSKEGELAAVVPLMEERGFRVGVPCRVWVSMSNDHSCRFDWIMNGTSDEERIRIVEALAAYLARRTPRVHFVELQDLPVDSPILPLLLDAASRSGQKVGLRPELETPFIPIEGTWAAYYESISGHLRRNLRRRRRQLEEQGRVEVVCVTGEESRGASRLPDHLREGFRIEAMAWKESAGTAIRQNEGWADFYEEWARTAAERGWLRLYFLKLNDRPIAFYYTLVYERKLYYLKLGYDPAYARYSPGILLHQEILASAFEEKLIELDFLGPTMTWKEDWAKKKRPHVWVYLFQRGIIPQMIYLIKFKLFPYFKKVDWVDRLQRRFFAKGRLSPKFPSASPPQHDLLEEARKEAA
jgi:CelD/BcsL family acetyltransferase involved in cellulose biosynthesis